jgi:hypothetical protein
MEVHSPQTFKVNRHRVKPYIEMNFAPIDEDLAFQSVQYAASPRALEPLSLAFKCISLKQ